MKRLLMLTIFILFFTLGKTISAQEIITGNANAKSEVRTQINGNGNVQTHIEVEVNEVKKNLSATGPGEYKLEINSSSSSSDIATLTITPVMKRGASIKKQNQSFISNFGNILQDFWKSLLRIFKI